jgi:hypothetical protein
MLQHQKDKACDSVVTIDDSWFYFTTDHDWIWLPEVTEAPKREGIIIQSRKIMVTIVWDPTGFYRIVALHKGMKFDAAYAIPQMVDPLAE